MVGKKSDGCGLSCMPFTNAFTGKPHFWSEIIVSHLYFITVLDNLSRYPFLLALGKRILPWATTSVRDKHSGFTRKQVER